MWHLHKWTVVDQKALPAPFEQLQLGVQSPREVQYVTPWLFAKPVIVTYKCQKCGAMRVVRV